MSVDVPLHEDEALLLLVERYLDDVGQLRREDTSVKQASARAVLIALEPYLVRA